MAERAVRTSPPPSHAKNRMDGVSHPVAPMFSFDEMVLSLKLYVLIVKREKRVSGFEAERHVV